jgi:DNA-binding XRE family transcriptional regulator
MIDLKELKKMRERAGLTQTELAAKVGVSSKSVLCWETGTHKPHPKRAKKLNQILSQLLRENEKKEIFTD